MGQKVNPNIFRLGVKENWKTTFFEKKNKELSHHVFQDLEVIEYIKRFLEIRGIYCHDYKVQYNDVNVNIYISYFAFTTAVFKKNEKNFKLAFRNLQENEKTLHFKTKTSSNPVENHLSRLKKHKQISKTSTNLYKNTLNDLKTLSSFKKKKLLDNQEFSVTQNIAIEKLETDFQSFLICLGQYLKKTSSINLILSCINSNHILEQKQKKVLKKNLMFLQKFKNTSYFKNILNICFIVLTNKQSSDLLAFALAKELKTLRRHKPLINLLKNFFSLFLKSTLSTIKGIRITLKGKLNGAPRAKHKTIIIGNVPIQPLDAKVCYTQAVANNPNGSYGLKIWVVEK